MVGTSTLYGTGTEFNDLYGGAPLHFEKVGGGHHHKKKRKSKRKKKRSKRKTKYCQCNPCRCNPCKCTKKRSNKSKRRRRKSKKRKYLRLIGGAEDIAKAGRDRRPPRAMSRSAARRSPVVHPTRTRFLRSEPPPRAGRRSPGRAVGADDDVSPDAEDLQEPDAGTASSFRAEPRPSPGYGGLLQPRAGPARSAASHSGSAMSRKEERAAKLDKARSYLEKTQEREPLAPQAGDEAPAPEPETEASHASGAGSGAEESAKARGARRPPSPTPDHSSYGTMLQRWGRSSPVPEPKPDLRAAGRLRRRKMAVAAAELPSDKERFAGA